MGTNKLFWAVLPTRRMGDLVSNTGVVVREWTGSLFDELYEYVNESTKTYPEHAYVLEAHSREEALFMVKMKKRHMKRHANQTWRIYKLVQGFDQYLYNMEQSRLSYCRECSRENWRKFQDWMADSVEQLSHIKACWPCTRLHDEAEYEWESVERHYTFTTC